MTTTMTGISLDPKGLDDAQRRVVDHDGGRLVVGGGPGTGKSTVLVERWVRLASTVTAPHRVLLLVHSRERALALRDALPWRLEQRAIVDVPAHTWQAFAFHLVARYHARLGFAVSPVLLGDAEQWAVVRELLAGEDAAAWGPYGDNLTTRPMVDEVVAFVNKAGMRCCADDDLADDSPVAAFTKRYRRHLLDSGRLDRSGLVAVAASLLADDADVAEAVRLRFPHVLVDDAHDLHPAHEALLAHLAQDHLVRAGEVDEADVRLETGYRRAATELRVLGTFADEIECAARAVRAAHLHDDVPYERMAVLLVQPSTYLTPLRRALDALGVPYRDGGERPLHAERAARAVLDLCRVALGIDRGGDLAASLMTSALVGVAPHDVRERRREAFRRGVPLYDLAHELRELEQLVRDDEAADATFFRIFRGSAWCRSRAAARTTDADAARDVDVLAALADALGRFVERDPGATMRAYLQAGTEPTVGTSSGRGVEVVPVAAAKGREWDVVCVVGVAEGALPRGHALFDPWKPGTARERALAEIAEERAVLHHALTRARRRLHVSSSPGTKRLAPSHLLEEVFGPLPEPEIAAPGEPLTVAEAIGSFRRTLASPDGAGAEKAAAAAALRSIGATPGSWWWTRDFTPGPPLSPDGALVTSYSRIGKYDNCPLQYVLESVLGLDPTTTFQMRFGSLVHRIFELGDTGKLSTRDEAIALYQKEFLDHHRADYPNDVFARTFYRAGVKMIKRWWDSERNPDDTVEVEFAFDDLEFQGHRIRGRIDRVARSERGLVLSDYKTSMSMATKQEAEESLQLAIYYLAAKTYDRLRLHGEPVSMQLVYPGLKHWETDGCAKRYQNAEQAEAALDRLRGILERAVAEKFDPSPTADCQWCSMRPLCPRYLEGRELGP